MKQPNWSNVPERYHPALQSQWMVCENALAQPLAAPVLDTLPQVWAASELVVKTCQQQPDIFDELEQPTPDFLQALNQALQQTADEAGVMQTLRRFRNRHMARLAWRDIAGWDEVPTTLQAVSDLADACVQAALTWLQQHWGERFGTPRSRAGVAQQLIVLGMGKLGGGELNFSSDIDLIFAFPEPGETDGDKVIDNQDYFTRQGRELIKLLDARTADGFVHRVDMRLRPFGDSGPLVMHSQQTEDYYEQHGRDWERYALVKARAIAGDIDAGEALLTKLQPFIFRRYLDYLAIAELRKMHGMITAQAQRKGQVDHLKTGRGGIRELEFIVQLFQLVHGGQDQRLRTRSWFDTVAALAEREDLPATILAELKTAYRFHRQLENRLQQHRDEQTHSLPVDDEARARLALSMNQPDWAALAAQIAQQRDCVNHHFQALFASDEAEQTADDNTLWAQAIEREGLDQALLDMGFDAPEIIANRLHALRKGRLYAQLSDAGREQLDQLMPAVFTAAQNTANPTQTAERLLTVIEAIGRRPTYFALLVERPVALQQLTQLCAASPWLTRQLAQHPMLLDELLDPRELLAQPSRAHLAAELQRKLSHIAADDLEQQLDLLRDFKHTHVLHIASADINAGLPLMNVSDRLTELAEVLLSAAFELAWQRLTAKHGAPQCMDDGRQRPARFQILAYGKMGGIELGYGSDLDVVFIHDSRGTQQQTDGEKPLENAVFFARLAQQLVSVLNTNTRTGILYECDTRLRPSGNSGLLVSSLDAFANYQQQSAWTWEHQALVRARPIVGMLSGQKDFAQIRAEILTKPREAAALRQEIVDMRQKMRDALNTAKAGEFHLKHSSGGIADIEFIVQYAVLRWAGEHADLLTYTDNIRILQRLSEAKLMPAEDAQALIAAYQKLRQRGHACALQDQKTIIPDTELMTERAVVRRVWQQMLDD